MKNQLITSIALKIRYCDIDVIFIDVPVSECRLFCIFLETNLSEFFVIIETAVNEWSEISACFFKSDAF